jgi:hypothetical protein
MTSRANLLCLTAIGLPNEYEHSLPVADKISTRVSLGLLIGFHIIVVCCISLAHLSHSYDFYHIYYDPALIVTIAAFAFSRTCSCKLRSASAPFSVSTSLRWW